MYGQSYDEISRLVAVIKARQSRRLVYLGHKGWNFSTDECEACGANRYEIDDNIVKTCEPLVGPHRLALIEIRRVMRNSEIRAFWCSRHAREVEKGQMQGNAEAWYAESHELSAKVLALRTSFETLLLTDKVGLEPKLPLGDAIERSLTEYRSRL